MAGPVEIAAGVFVTTSRLDCTTSTLVVDGSSALLVDPAWTNAELAALADAIDGLGAQVTAGFATHAHHDHVLWHPRFATAPRWASPRTAALARAHQPELVELLGPGWPAELAALVGLLTPTGERTIPAPFGDRGRDEPVELIVHDGHAPGHSALWFPERRILVAGDMLSDVELPLPFDPDDLPAYRSALDLLAPFVARAEVLVPGHGTPSTDPGARLDADRRYLDALAAGADPPDPRRGNPGMAAVHDRLRMLSRTVPG